MMSRNAILPAAAYIAAAFMLLLAPAARACSCSFRPLCDSIDFAGVLLRGFVLRRTEGEDQQFDDVAYHIRIITLFKTEDDVDYPEEIVITTAANSAQCGIYLELGEEYLLDLYRYEGELRSVGICGATQSWTTLDEEKIATLEDIDTVCAADPCAACGEFEECLFYTGDIAEDQYYCSAVCDPSPCEEGEECSLTEVGCSVGSICGNGYACSEGEGGQQEAVVEEEDLCEGRCPEFYECLFYTGDIAEDQYYCSAVCDPSPCEEGEECSLTEVGCSAGSICGNGYVCSAAEDAAVEEEDLCEGRCPEFYECLFYTGDIAEDQYYCSAVCDPSPCEEGEECSLTEVGCSAGSICGNGYVCSAAEDDDEVEEQDAVVEDCAACGEFQDCLVWFNGAEEEYYCADLCDPSPCTGDETCSLEERDDCDTAASPCPPVAACSASLVAAEEETETGTDEETQEDSSSALLAAGSVTTAAVLMTTLLLGL